MGKKNTKPRKSATQDRASQQRDFVSELLAEILAATESMPAGDARLRKSITTFLDACLEHRPLRQALLSAEIDDQQLHQAAQTRRNNFRSLLALELAAMQIAEADRIAAELRDLIEAVSLAEVTDGSPLAPQRARIWSFLDQRKAAA